ncbi:MAG TPA: ATP-binding cassette domain-containing protein [Burkholderiaceae bacterium]|jgi:phospholipid/cholesterol/gamma-HCH transport system ATP-binding protein|nr:ATP-binding cassette domain-containing protein [Burkholderiaceae bacterium]
MSAPPTDHAPAPLAGSAAEGRVRDSGDGARAANVIEVRGVVTRFGEHVVHDGVDLDVKRAETFAIVGGSGSGKSTLLRELIMLHRPQAGSIRVLGQDVLAMDEDDLGDPVPARAARRGGSSARAQAPGAHLRQRIGVMFQQGGLFASLTVAENVGMPLREFTALDDKLVDEIAAWKIALTGLEPAAGLQYPAELSGGMHQRAALARALALDPELLFLDEPTAGLDPASADGVGELVQSLRELLGLTVVVITHDLDLLWQVADRVAVLGGGKVRGVGSMKELSTMEHPDIRAFFEGPRARAAEETAHRNATA